MIVKRLRVFLSLQNWGWL